jgi:GNAT superfamily N-acetyltransferase
MQDELIKRLDRVESESFIQLYSAGRAWGTGWHTEDSVTSVWSSRDDDPSFSCVLNLGDARDPATMLAHLESVAASRGAVAFGVDTHPVLAWATDERLRALGYQPDSEECIWALDLAANPEGPPMPDGVVVRHAEPSDRDAFVRALNIGWSLEEDAARGHIFAETIGHDDWLHYLALIEGEVAGIAVLFIHDQVADCFLAATLPDFRGKGVQTALIERRLQDGRARGCRLATSQTVVYNASPRNMARRGFEPLYRRWIYGKQLQGE